MSVVSVGAGLCWAGLGWAVLCCSVLGWAGLGCAVLCCAALCWGWVGADLCLAGLATAVGLAVRRGPRQVAVKIVKRAGLPEDDEKALKDEVRTNIIA